MARDGRSFAIGGEGAAGVGAVDVYDIDGGLTDALRDLPVIGFGRAVSLSDDGRVLVVGAPNDSRSCAGVLDPPAPARSFRTPARC